MMDGTRFNSTCLISHAEHTVPTTLKPSESRSMQTVGFAESTFRTDYTQKMNCQQNSNFTSLCNRRNNETIFFYIFFPLVIICIYIQVQISRNQPKRTLLLKPEKNTNHNQKENVSQFDALV